MKFRPMLFGLLILLLFSSSALAGNFYVNLTIRTTAQEDVSESLKEAGVPNITSPAIDGYVVAFIPVEFVYEYERFLALGRDLSKKMKTAILVSVVMDDDDLILYGWNSGELFSEYASRSLEDESKGPEGKSLERFCEFFSCRNVKDLNTVLLQSPNEGKYVLETDRHRDVFRLLSLPLMAVGYGYKYIKQGELPDGFKLEDFIE